jgi:hypothetical protein
MHKKLIFFFALATSALPAIAQVETQTVQTNSNAFEETKVLYRNEATGGLIVHGHGFGFNYRRGKHVTGYKKRVFEMELVNYRHPKEIKVVNPAYDNAKGYYYGKLNSLFILRPGIGFQKVIYTKPDRNGVEIRFVYFVGASLGFAKPIYLEILKETPINSQYELVTERYNPDEHYVDNIYGRSPYIRGFGEMKIHPGAYGKVGFSFEYGALDDDVKCLETGVIVDGYPKVIPLMANEHNQQVLVSLYLHFAYGRKWF